MFCVIDYSRRNSLCVATRARGETDEGDTPKSSDDGRSRSQAGPAGKERACACGRRQVLLLLRTGARGMLAAYTMTLTNPDTRE